MQVGKVDLTVVPRWGVVVVPSVCASIVSQDSCDNTCTPSTTPSTVVCSPASVTNACVIHKRVQCQRVERLDIWQHSWMEMRRRHAPRHCGLHARVNRSAWVFPGALELAGRRHGSDRCFSGCFNSSCTGRRRARDTRCPTQSTQRQHLATPKHHQAQQQRRLVSIHQRHVLQVLPWGTAHAWHRHSSLLFEAGAGCHQVQCMQHVLTRCAVVAAVVASWRRNTPHVADGAFVAARHGGVIHDL